MAFNINAHVILQGPKNIKAVTNSIKQQLQGISVPVNLQTGQVSSATQQINTLNKGMKGLQGSAAATSSSLSNVNKATTKVATSLNKSGAAAKGMGKNLQGVASQAGAAAGAMNTLGRETALTFKRFAAAGIVTATVFRLGGAIAEATGNALEFQREMVKLEQITGKSAVQLGKLKKAVTETSKELGVSALELAGIARLFAQTGQNLREVEASMKAIARSSLAPTFGEMAQTAEGLVAALNQFGIGANQAEAVLGSLNRVSKKFAVESQDLIAAIRRAGGVFALAAGQFKEPIQALNEFSAIFTAVRSTTRESAETIATGLRTIFTRIQRRSTIDMLKGLGISLVDTQGKFIGLFESFKKLSTGLDQLVQKGDAVTLSAITEELGGMRQVGKLLPAIREFKKAEQALKEAQKGVSEGLGKDVAKGLTPLIKQFEILGTRFDDFIRKISEGATFKKLAEFAIDTANAFISLGEALAPILPLLTQLAAMKLARGAFSFGQGFFSSTKGLGAQGVGARAGSLISGSGGAAAGGTKQSSMTNTTALGKNTKALSVLSSSFKPLSSLSGDFTKLNTAMNNLKDEVRKLASISRARPMAPSYGGGSSGGSRRGRRPFGGGGRVRFAKPIPQVPWKDQIISSRGSGMGGGPLLNRYRGQKTSSFFSSKSAGRTGMGNTNIDVRKGISSRATKSTTFGMVALRDSSKGVGKTKLQKSGNTSQAFNATIAFGGTQDQPGMGIGNVNKKLSSITGNQTDSAGRQVATIQVLGDSVSPAVADRFEAGISKGMMDAVDEQGAMIQKKFGQKVTKGTVSLEEAGVSFPTISGNLFEAMLNNIGGRFASSKVGGVANATWDYPKGIGPNLGQVFPQYPQIKTLPSDAKRSINKDLMLSMLHKGKNHFTKLNERFNQQPTRRASHNLSTSQILAQARASNNGTKSKVRAAKGLQGSQVSDPNYWTDDGELKAILMPGELVSYDANPATARQIAAGNVGAVRSLSKRNTSVVPGSGNRDTYPMDLPPGTVVVPKGLSQEAMGEGYEPRKPLATGGRVGRGRVKMVRGSGGRTGNAPSGGGMGLAGSASGAQLALGTLADAAVGVSFALSMMDFSTFEGALMSITQLTFVIPSALASLKQLPLIIGSIKSSAGFSSFKNISKRGAPTIGGINAAVAGGATRGQLLGGGMMSGIVGASPLAKLGAGAGKAGEGFATKFMNKMIMAAPQLGIVAGIALAAVAGEALGSFLGKKIAEYFGGKTKKGRVEGVEGYESTGTAQGVALGSAVGGTAGAAALGFAIAGPIGALAGAVYGITKAYFKWQETMAKQAEFEAFEKLGKSADKAADTLAKFNAQATFSAGDLRKVNTDVSKFSKELTAVTGFSQEAAYTERVQPTALGIGGGAAAGAIIGSIFPVIGTAVGAAIGAIVGGVSEYALKASSDAGSTEDMAKAGTKTLEMVTDKLINGINQVYEKTQSAVLEGLPDTTNTLEKLAALSTSVGAGDLTLSEATADFELLKKTLAESGEKGKAFSEFLETKLFYGVLENLKGASDETKALYSAANMKGIDITNIAGLRSNLDALSEASGLSRKATSDQIDVVARFTQVQLEQIVQQNAQMAKMIRMNRLLKLVSRSMDLFIIGLEKMAAIGEQAATRFGMFGSELDAFASKTLSGEGGILTPERSFINPFKNLENSTEAAIQGGLDKIKGVSGADVSGLDEVLKIRNKLPEIMSGLVKRAETDPGLGGKIGTADQLTGLLEAELKENFGIIFSDLPKTIRDGLVQGLSGSLKRQGGGGADIRSIVEDQDFQGLISKFGEGTEKTRAALEKFYSAITNAEKTLISIINQQVKLQKFEIEQSLRAVAILHATNDSLDRFRDKTDSMSTAWGKLSDRLNAIDGGRGNVTFSAAQQQAQVAATRRENKQIRDDIRAAGGPAIGADMSASEINQALTASGTMFDSAVMKLVDELQLNERALTRETKKLEELINETERLGAINETLSAIQKAQMDSEAQARYFIQGLARAEGETDPIRRGAILKEIMMPFTAWSKALSGGTLNMREFASLVENFDSRIRPLLRSQGVSESEINNVRRGFFAKFSSVFPDIFSSAVSQSFVSVQGPLQTALGEIARSMVAAGMAFEDLSVNQFPAMFADAMKVLGDNVGNSVAGIMGAAAQIAEDKAIAISKEASDKIDAIQEAIAKNVVKLTEDGKKIDEHKDAVKASIEAIGNFEGKLKNFKVPELKFGGELQGLLASFTAAAKVFNDFKLKSEEKIDEAKEQEGRGEIKSYRDYKPGPTTDNESRQFLLDNPKVLQSLFDKLLMSQPYDWRGAGKTEMTRLQMLPPDKKDYAGMLDQIERVMARGYGSSYLLKANENAMTGNLISDLATMLMRLEDTGTLTQEETQGFFSAQRAGESKYGRVKGGKEEYKTGLATYRMLQEEKYAGTSEADVRKEALAKGAALDPRMLEGLDKDTITEFIGYQSTDALRRMLAESKVREISGQGPNALYDALNTMGEEGKAASRELLEPLGAIEQSSLDTADNTSQMLDIMQNGDGGADAMGAKGGFLRGRSHQSGGMMAELEGGEFVFSKAAVRRLGRGNLDALNSGSATLRSPTAYGKKGGYAGSYGVGGTVLSSLSDLTNIASNMDFSQFSQLIEKMNNFSAGNGMSQIMGSNAVSGTGGILEEMMKRQMEAVQGGGQKQQSIRQQLDEVFQKRLGSLTGGLGTKKGQQLNNLLKKFSTIATALGGVENAEGRAGGKNALTAIEKTLKRFGQTSDQITNTMEIFKSLLGDEQTNLSQEEQLLKNMGLLKGKGSGGDDLLKQLKAMMGAQSDLLAPTKEIAKNTANCDCIDKLIAYLHGFPVEIGAEFGKQAGAGVAGGPGAGGPGAGGPGSKVPPKRKPFSPTLITTLPPVEPIPPGDFGGLGPGGGPRQTPELPPSALPPELGGLLEDFGGFLGNPFEGLGGLLGGLMPRGGGPGPGTRPAPDNPALWDDGTPIDPSDRERFPIQPGETGGFQGNPKGFGDFFGHLLEMVDYKNREGGNGLGPRGGGAGFSGFQNVEDEIPRKSKSRGNILGSMFSAITKSGEGLVDTFKAILPEADSMGASLGKAALNALAAAAEMKDFGKLSKEEQEAYRRSVLTPEQRIDESVIKERNAAERGAKGTPGAGLITRGGLEEAVRKIRGDDSLSKMEKILAEVKIRDTESQLGITGGGAVGTQTSKNMQIQALEDLNNKGRITPPGYSRNKVMTPEEKADLEKDVKSTAETNRTMRNKGTTTGSLERRNRDLDLIMKGGKGAANRAKFFEKYGTKEDRGGGSGGSVGTGRSSFEAGPATLKMDKSNQDKLAKLNEERAKKGLKAQTLSQAIADKKQQRARETNARVKAYEEKKKKDTKKAVTDPSAAKTLKDAMGIKDKGAKETQKEIKKQTVQIKGGLCGCFERSIDKLIAFLAGYAVEISSEFTKIFAGGGGGIGGGGIGGGGGGGGGGGLLTPNPKLPLEPIDWGDDLLTPNPKLPLEPIDWGDDLLTPNPKLPLEPIDWGDEQLGTGTIQPDGTVKPNPTTKPILQGGASAIGSPVNPFDSMSMVEKIAKMQAAKKPTPIDKARAEYGLPPEGPPDKYADDPTGDFMEMENRKKNPNYYGDVPDDLHKGLPTIPAPDIPPADLPPILEEGPAYPVDPIERIDPTDPTGPPPLEYAPSKPPKFSPPIITTLPPVDEKPGPGTGGPGVGGGYGLGLCGCFERAIDKLIRFLAGEEVTIGGAGGGGGGLGGPGTPVPAKPQLPPGTMTNLLGSIGGAIGGAIKNNPMIQGAMNIGKNVISKLPSMDSIKEGASKAWEIFQDIGTKYEGKGSKPFVATPERDASGQFTGYAKVPKRSSASPTKEFLPDGTKNPMYSDQYGGGMGASPLFLGTGRAGQKRYETMKRNRDKFATQLEDPEFAAQAEKDPKGYAARIKAQKTALDMNIRELERKYGFGAGEDTKGTPAAKDQVKKDTKPTTGPAPTDAASAKTLVSMMGFGGFGGGGGGAKRKIKLTDTPIAAAMMIIDFLKNNCLKVEPCGGGDDLLTPNPKLPLEPIDWGDDLLTPNPKLPLEPIDWGDEQLGTGTIQPDGTVKPNPTTKPILQGGGSAIGSILGNVGGAMGGAMGGLGGILSGMAGSTGGLGGFMEGLLTTPFMPSGASAGGISNLLEPLPPGAVSAGSGPMSPTPTAGEEVGTLAGPLISDETVNRLVEFGSMFAAGGTVNQIFDGFVGRLESVVSSISKIPSSIELTLQTPRVEVIVNANNISDRIGQVVQSMIFEQVGRKFENLSARITNLENNNGPMGNDSGATYPNNP